MQIPWQELDAATLDNLITEIVTRDGTDYGEVEMSTPEKLAQVKRLLKAKQMTIVYDDATETCGLMSLEDALRMEKLAAEQ